ncbi:hypothetical protein TrCOL_g10291 [Triparma columacea]|uniref:aspartyl aminopeptidase n=1 Tax=Triparma columacea TaxID=722753 RepID=A0A9W7GGL4_9STRA|nr:hypothetical protein TrCOL_g10291 [Triparma columacea]
MAFSRRSLLVLCSILAVSFSCGLNMPAGVSISRSEKMSAQGLQRFLDSSPEPHHATYQSVKKLKELKFEELDERHCWKDKIKAGGRYFFQRDPVLGSSVVAFVVGGKFDPSSEKSGGFKVLGAHTDSPNLRVKPRSARSASGCLQLDVETYGGGLWHTWFDRDLSIAGKVVIRNDDGVVEQRLVNLERPILRIPNLAIHLQTAAEREAFKVNKEDHLQPILATEVKKTLEGAAPPPPSPTSSDAWQKAQSPLLLTLLGSSLGVDPSSICDFTLSLYDVQPSSLSGAYDEFITSARIDNLFGCYVSLEALLEYVRDGEDVEDEDISVVALFDHEEVGSSSTQGAGSTLINDAVGRITRALDLEGRGDQEARVRRSMVVSFDMAHALHPNYPSKHEKYHDPKINEGVVIKTNSNQRYASNLVTTFISREIGRSVGREVQEFVVRNDCPCGSTIGPIISSLTGMQAVDVGTPQLSMHSIREMAGVKDVSLSIEWMKAFLKEFRRIECTIQPSSN